MSFCDLLISLGRTSRIAFFAKTEEHCVVCRCLSCFLHSSLGVDTRGAWLWRTTLQRTGMCKYPWNVASNSYGCTIRSEIAPSRGKSISSFGGNSAPCSTADGPFYTFTDTGPGFQCLQILPNTGCLTVFGFGVLLVAVVDRGRPKGVTCYVFVL